MNRWLFFIILLLVPCPFIIAQFEWSHPKPQGNILSGVWFITAEKGLVAGKCGTIMRTEDGGETWLACESQTSQEVHTFHFPNPDTGYAIGGSDSQVLLRSVDGGEHWEKMFEQDDISKLYDLCFTTGLNGFLVGAGGIIRKTEDGGVTWHNVVVSQGARLFGVDFSTPSTGIVTGEKGTLLRTVNGGVTWTPADHGLHNIDAFTLVDFVTPEVGFVFGRRGYAEFADKGFVIKTTDSGLTWELCKDSLWDYMNDMQFVSTDTGFLTRGSGRFHRTTDGGSTWDTINMLNPLEAFCFVNGTTGFGVNGDRWSYSGQVGVLSKILRTTDAGFSWTEISDHAGISSFRAVDFPTSKTGYVVGGIQSSSELLKTEDGGFTWTNVLDSLWAKTTFSDLCFIHEDTGFLCSYDGLILKTTNGANTWKGVAGDSYVRFFAIDLYRLDLGIAIAQAKNDQDSCMYIFRSMNGGESWSKMAFPYIKWPRDIEVLNDSIAFLTGIPRNDYGAIFRTTDHGQTWQKVLSLLSGWVNDLCFVNRDTGFALTFDELYFTHDGGSHWLSYSLPEGPDYYRCCFTSSSVGYLAGLKGVVAKTDDGGRSWTPLESHTENDLNDISFPTPDSGFIVGSYCSILFTASGTVLDMPEIPFCEVGNRSVVYPNPAGSKVTIAFTIESPGFVSLILYNLRGEIISHPLNGYRNAGEQTVAINTAAWPPGVYIYRITSGSHHSSGKIVVCRP